MNIIKWLVNTMIATMIFFPTKEFVQMPEDFGLQAEDVYLNTEDNVRLHGWFLPAPESKTCLLLLHGNAGNISMRLFKAKDWVTNGVSVFLLDYRGYGKSEGSIKKGSDLMADSRAAVTWLNQRGFQNRQVILYGESIGSAPAVELASQEAFHSLILESAFTSMEELGKKHYGPVAGMFLGDFKLDNETIIGKARCPVFILHGTQDEIAPFSMAEKLYEKAPGPKEIFAIQDGTHNELSVIAGKDFFEKPLRFIQRAASQAENT